MVSTNGKAKSLGTEFTIEARKTWAAALPEPTLAENAVTVLEKRYLRRGADLELEETPKDLFARVAYHVAQGREAEATQYYTAMANGEFMPNSPTLFNAGTGNGLGLSACYILIPEDSLESIVQVKADLMMIQKAGGGVGYDFSRLRPRGCLVRSCGATTDGPLPFIDSFCSDTNAIQQGAKRRGAQMGMLWVWHPDIWDFIHAKEDLSRWQNMNVSVKVTDEFMQSVIDDPQAPHRVHHNEWGEGILIRNKETGKVTSAKDGEHHPDISTPVTVGELFNEICIRAWTTGEPGLAFWDQVTRDWVFSGSGMYPIEATNPCGEIPGEDGMSCNLASLNLAKLFRQGKMNFDGNRYTELIQETVRFLDGVVEVNQFPVEKIAQMNKETRRIGLGVMGFADLLFQLQVPYDSDEGRDIARNMSQILRVEALNESVELARLKGAFPAAIHSDYEGQAPRNAYQTMIAPTGTISIFADCSCGIEPLYSLAFTRRVMRDGDGIFTEMTEVNPYFKAALEELADNPHDVDLAIAYAADHGTIRGFKGVLSERDEWQKLVEVFQTAKDVSMRGHVLMQAAWQEGLDQACSKTINLPNEASLEDVQDAYKLAWQNGCKGITVYRDGCRDGIEGQVQPMGLTKKVTDTGPDLTVEDVLPKEQMADMKQLAAKYFDDVEIDRGALENLPDIRESLTIKQRTPLGTMHVTIVHEGGEAKEIFGQITKSGEQPAADVEAICRLASLVLRLGGTIEMVLKQLERIGSSQLMLTAHGKIMSIPDGLGVAIKRGMRELQNSADSEWVAEAVDRTTKKQQRKEIALYREVCPECSAVLYDNSGCQSCTDPACGYARC